MISYRFVPISSQKGVLFFETPGRFLERILLENPLQDLNGMTDFSQEKF